MSLSQKAVQRVCGRNQQREEVIHLGDEKDIEGEPLKLNCILRNK